MMTLTLEKVGQGQISTFYLFWHISPEPDKIERRNKKHITQGVKGKKYDDDLDLGKSRSRSNFHLLTILAHISRTG